MTDLFLENLKLIILFLLIGSIIGLSHVSGENLTKMKRAIRERRWREIGSIAASLATGAENVAATYRNLMKPKASGSARQMDRVQAGAGTPTIASRLREMFDGRLCVNIFDAIAEARAQKAMIEAELYQKRYLHSSKNDDDLPIIR